MRTDSNTTRAAAVDRLRAEFARARRRFKAQTPALRWALGLAALAGLVALSYAATVTPTPAGGYVRGGERFSADDLVAIRRALNAKHVRHRVDDRNRVEVAADQLDAANDALAKLEVGPRPLAEIEGWAATTGLLDSIATTQQRQERATSAKLEEMIRPMDGVVSAHVIVNRPKSRGGFRPATAATAFVYLETEGNRELSSATVESIQGLIAGAVPDVKHDAVSVFDRKGRHYLDHRNPALGAEVMNRRRRERLREEILDNLDGIKGAQVSVQLVAAAVVPPPVPHALPALPPPSAAPEPSPAPAPSAPAEAPSLPPSSMSVNQPLELPEEVAPAPAPARAPSPPAPAPAPASVPVPAPALATVEPLPPKAKVWVKVPRSFYLKAIPNRDPSFEDLQPLVERTKALIETAVRHVVPPGQLDEPVVISTIPDDSPAVGPPPAPPAAETETRRLLWWVPVGFAVAAIAGGLTTLFVLAARRPALRRAGPTRDDHGRYKIDEATEPGPGPSERVRELIRLNPEAAASVLHRWTGQGESLG